MNYKLSLIIQIAEPITVTKTDASLLTFFINNEELDVTKVQRLHW